MTQGSLPESWCEEVSVSSNWSLPRTFQLIHEKVCAELKCKSFPSDSLCRALCHGHCRFPRKLPTHLYTHMVQCNERNPFPTSTTYIRFVVKSLVKFIRSYVLPIFNFFLVFFDNIIYFLILPNKSNTGLLAAQIMFRM